MKKQIKYHILSIPNKLTFDIKLTLDENNKGIFTSNINDVSYTTLNLFPMITLGIIRPPVIGDDGIKMKAPYNPNDAIVLGRYIYPKFVCCLEDIYNGMKIPELYSYTDKRLELNDEIAEKIRKVFVVGTTMTNMIELAAVVIVQPDESRVEGIKMKFNNEASSVLLTLNDMESLLFTMKFIDIDSIVMHMFQHYLRNNTSNEININRSNIPIPNIDILVPKDGIVDSIGLPF